MRKKRKTIILVKVRRHIRNAISWSKVDDGEPHFYKTKNYKNPGRPSKNIKGFVIGVLPYYNRSTKAIEEIAEKIYELFENEINELKHITEWQGNILKKFGNELHYFQKQQGYILYEIKLKNYRDEILQLKKEAQRTKK